MNICEANKKYTSNLDTLIWYKKKFYLKTYASPKKDEEMNYVWSDMMYSVVMNRNSNFPINRIHMDFIILPSKKDDIIFVEEQITKPQIIGIDLALIHQILIIFT